MNYICILLLFLISTSTERSHYTASASDNEFTKAYLQWFVHHREAAPGGNLLKLEMPALDLYTPAGVSIYYGTDAEANADFLRKLSKGIPAATPQRGRPTLKEAIEMVPGFRTEENELLADKRYTIFAVTYPHWADARAQNDAIAELRKTQNSIRILEVRLQQ